MSTFGINQKKKTMRKRRRGYRNSFKKSIRRSKRRNRKIASYHGARGGIRM